jgi:hypothetical protein
LTAGVYDLLRQSGVDHDGLGSSGPVAVTVAVTGNVGQPPGAEICLRGTA